MRGDAVDEQPSPNANRALGSVGQHRLLVGQIGARGVPLQPGLLVGGEAQHVVHDRAGGQLGVGGVDAARRPRRRSAGRGSAPSPRDCPAAKLADTSSAPSVCDSRASRSRRADRGDAVVPAGRATSSTRLEDPVGDGAEQLLLVGEVPVQRAGGDVELAGQPAHRQVGDAVGVEQLGRRVDHVASVQLHPGSLNTVQVGSATSSSDGSRLSTTRRRVSDILEQAREQVLERGEGLDQDQMLRVLQLPDDRLDELLALAHEVRMAWCGPDVEVEGIISLKTGGCPEDCHFCSQSGLFASPVRSAWLDIPSLVEAAKQTAKTGATEFCIVAAVRGPDERLLAQVAAGIEAIRNEVDIQIACSLGMLTQEQVERLVGDGRAPLQPQPGDRAVVLHQRRHHPHVGGALGHPADGPRGGHGGVLRRHPRHG